MSKPQLPPKNRAKRKDSKVTRMASDMKIDPSALLPGRSPSISPRSPSPSPRGAEDESAVGPDPSFSRPTKPLPRPQGNASGGKLVHANKSRAKGATNRRLPTRKNRKITNPLPSSSSSSSSSSLTSKSTPTTPRQKDNDNVDDDRGRTKTVSGQISLERPARPERPPRRGTSSGTNFANAMKKRSPSPTPQSGPISPTASYIGSVPPPSSRPPIKRPDRPERPPRVASNLGAPSPAISQAPPTKTQSFSTSGMAKQHPGTFSRSFTGKNLPNPLQEEKEEGGGEKTKRGGYQSDLPSWACPSPSPPSSSSSSSSSLRPSSSPSSLPSDPHAARSLLLQKESELEQLRSEFSRVHSSSREFRKLSRKPMEIPSDAGTLIQQNLQLSSFIQELERENEVLRSNTQKLEHDCMQANSVIYTQRKMLEKLEASKNSTEHQLEAVRSNCNALSSEIEQLRLAFVSKEEELEHLLALPPEKLEILEKERRVEKLRGQLKQLQGTYSSKVSALESGMSEEVMVSMKLQEELKNIKEANKELKRQLEDANRGLREDAGGGGGGGGASRDWNTDNSGQMRQSKPRPPSVTMDLLRQGSQRVSAFMDSTFGPSSASSPSSVIRPLSSPFSSSSSASSSPYGNGQTLNEPLLSEEDRDDFVVNNNRPAAYPYCSWCSVM